MLKEKVKEAISWKWKSDKSVQLLKNNSAFRELFNTFKKTKSSLEALEETISDRRQKLGFLFKTEILPPLPNEPKEVVKEQFFKELEEEKMTKFKLAEFGSKYK